MPLPHRDTPRVPPVSDSAPESAELFSLGRFGPDGRPMAIFRTMAHHPALLERWNGFAGFFRTVGAVPARTRELVVLRTAWRIGCRYEWGQHVLIARDAGLTDAEIARLPGPRPAEDGHVGMADADELLVRFVDELIDNTDVTDATWHELNSTYTTQQIFELIMLVGLYRMAGGFLNVTGVQPDPYLPNWPDD